MQPIIWIGNSVLASCRADADEHFPLESGGVFLGYETGDAMVITAMIPGGEQALRTRWAYAPDTDWQNSRIAEHYEQSGRLDTYLGDWHSHPGTDRAYLSGDDRVVLRKIIRSPKTRLARPLMCVLVGTSGDWRMHGWRADLRTRRFWADRVELTAVRIENFVEV